MKHKCITILDCVTILTISWLIYRYQNKHMVFVNSLTCLH